MEQIIEGVKGQINTLTGKKAFTSIAVCSSNGMLITGSVDPIVRLWDPRSHEGTLVKQSFIGHCGWISSVFWNKMRENLFISASFDKTVKIWDIRSNKTPLYDLVGHSDRILCCDWSVNEIIVSGGVDCTIKTYRRKI
ncbi:WD domain, G-beta repeat protein [Onchocerca flexuosa]|uniref:WD domain, G-beta repeat protein n=1 Tax=Onchocerca flexuosa TaxID=387005 RepID=A0A238C587_9BILA|nr:WD domain, G-beta repeat protein [Onchocerca flexuosa]